MFQTGTTPAPRAPLAALRQTAAPARLRARIASGAADRAAAFALRHRVFVRELGAGAVRGETDAFDAHAQHLVLEDPARPAQDRVIGTARLLGAEEAQAAGGFYGGREFDLGPLLRSGHRLLELGRTCLHPEYRGGAAMVTLWQALAAIVADRGVTLLFGTASFPGADLARHRVSLERLHREHAAPAGLRVVSRQGGWTASAAGPDGGSRLAAMQGVPALIKSYLRLGGVIGDGVFVDRDFNTTDVCLMLDVAALRPVPARLYAPAHGT